METACNHVELMLMLRNDLAKMRLPLHLYQLAQQEFSDYTNSAVLKDGDLTIMTGYLQWTHEHSVPKMPSVKDGRFNLT